ncbi:HNH endonuclease [Gemmatimonas sp.]|uniref:HNH endonuclease n=1 Tax=Gemmatimonas sp. TaxID=1962908 RepID=UPI003340D1CE
MRKVFLRHDFFVLVDEEDVALLGRHSYRPNGGYACRAGKAGEPKTVFLHREVLNAPQGMQVDHVNGIRHDCRRENLRLVTRQQNTWNSAAPKSKLGSRYKGVIVLRPQHYGVPTWGEGRKAFAARIRLNGKTVHLGCFCTEVEAALAYDSTAAREFGEFARLNFTPVGDLMRIKKQLDEIALRRQSGALDRAA